MKKILSFILVLTFITGIFSIIPVSAKTNEIITTLDFDYIMLEDGTLEIVGYHGIDTYLFIPTTTNGYKVTSIAKEVFKDNHKFESIVVCEGVKNISDRAFYNCKNVTKLSLPYSLETVGEECFYGIKATKLYIPEKITKIGNNMFAGMSELEEVIPITTITEVGKGAFSGTKISDLSFLSSVEKIDDYAFMNCNNINSVSMPKSITYCGEKIFAQSSLELVTFENGTKEIFASSFSDCSNLTKVNLPDTVVSIGAGAFENCTSLKSIDLPDNLEYVYDSAFFNCTSLKRVSIPKSIKSISECAFGFIHNGNTTDYKTSMGKDFSVYGYSDTVAKTYANKNGLNFIPLDFKVIIGDVDLNGVVNIFDATLIQQHSSKLTTLDNYQLINANVNNDDTVNVFDATQIQRMIAGLV